MPRFVGEEITPLFAEEPELEKKTGVPSGFKWRGQDYGIRRLVKEWHDYDQGRGGGGYDAGRPPFGQRNVLQRGSWGQGKDYYRVLLDDGRLVDIYYDRRPKNRKEKGRWVLFRELGEM